MVEPAQSLARDAVSIITVVGILFPRQFVEWLPEWSEEYAF